MFLKFLRTKIRFKIYITAQLTGRCRNQKKGPQRDDGDGAHAHGESPADKRINLEINHTISYVKTGLTTTFSFFLLSALAFGNRVLENSVKKGF